MAERRPLATISARSMPRPKHGIGPADSGGNEFRGSFRLRGMASLIVYYAHPGHKFSHVNQHMARAAGAIDGITFVDLYRDYPRFDIDVNVEQKRLLEHDVVLFQFPLFWYSTPSIIKEWEDLVLEHGFAYGSSGDKLAGKQMMLAVTGAGPAEAYTHDGFQQYPLRTFLTPLEQTARLCGMHFSAPYVLYESLRAPAAGLVEPHVGGYRQLLEAIRDDRYDFDAANRMDVVHFDGLPIGTGS
ncbi:MAG: NAD(P)H-dependent oxidoreductase [Gammaproteobacteria bacterium]|nr:NAD(P)H-dependent oxidoreductase [Gammaproteobacteria bacterium]